MIHTYHLLFSCSYALKSAQVLQANFILEPFLTFLFKFFFSLVKCKDCLKFNLPLYIYIYVYMYVFSAINIKPTMERKIDLGKLINVVKNPSLILELLFLISDRERNIYIEKYKYS